jgi:hypothetical protein
MRRFFSLLVFALACGIVGSQGCNGPYSGDCSNGTCACPPNVNCDFSCASPPCQVDCGSGSSCSAICANGDCTCEPGASCSFLCDAPPCHVNCHGDNPMCDGTCADGDCTCAQGSACHFRCGSGPCHTYCPADAHCIITCLNKGVTGTQDCDLATCGSGAPTFCPDGVTIACNAPCP